MGARTGARSFSTGLRRTKREIWVDGERIADVTSHPKLRGGAESLAAMFDRQHDYAAECLFTAPRQRRADQRQPHDPALPGRPAAAARRPGAPVGGLHGHHGPHARLHEHEVRGLRLGAARVGRRRRPQRTRRTQHRRLPAHIWPTAICRSPTRSSSPPSTSGPTAGSSATRSTSARSARRPRASSCAAARVLATLAPFADEQAVYPGQPIPAGATEAYALAFAIPLDTPGLEVPVPRFRVGARRRSVRQAAVVAIRRAGRLLHLRRRRGAVGPHVHRRRRRDLQLDARRPATPSA